MSGGIGCTDPVAQRFEIAGDLEQAVAIVALQDIGPPGGDTRPGPLDQGRQCGEPVAVPVVTELDRGLQAQSLASVLSPCAATSATSVTSVTAAATSSPKTWPQRPNGLLESTIDEDHDHSERCSRDVHFVSRGSSPIVILRSPRTVGGVLRQVGVLLSP